MTDIVERLRNPKYDCGDEAADEIERLRNDRAKWLVDCSDEVARLRADNASLRSLLSRQKIPMRDEP
jgi:hypothetical protein